MYAHDVLFERSRKDLLEVAVPFLAGALEAGEPAVTVCRAGRAAEIAEALGSPAALLQLRHEDVYRPPARALTAYRELVEAQSAGAGRRVRLVTDVAAGTTPWQRAEWARFEAVLDRAMAGYPLWSVCVYDTTELPADVLTVGARTHPVLYNGSGREPNGDYTDPLEVLRSTVGAVDDPLESTTPALDAVDPRDLYLLRRQVGEALTASQLPTRRRQDLVAAVSEVTTNALVHGRPPLRVRLWVTSGRALVAVRDGGAGFDDPYLGYLPPKAGQAERGMGLWLARQLCDHVDTARDRDGFVVRLTALA
jgi:anti-sigma regulatory factor (Ser/Thr protein kinase)